MAPTSSPATMAPGPDRAAVRGKIEQGEALQKLLLGKAQEILQLLKTLQGLLRENMTRGKDFEHLSQRLDGLKQVLEILDQINVDLKSTNDESKWVKVVFDGVDAIQKSLQSVKTNGNETFFQGLTDIIGQMAAVVKESETIEDDLLLPNNIEFGVVYPRVLTTENALLEKGFPTEDVRSEVKSTVLKLLTAVGEEGEKRAETMSHGTKLIGDYLLLFEHQQALIKSIGEAKNTFNIDEDKIRAEQKAHYDQKRHERRVQLKDELVAITRENSNPPKASQLAHGNCRDDIRRLDAEEKKAVQEAIDEAIKKAAEAAGNSDYLEKVTALEQVEGDIEYLLRFLQVVADMSESVKKAVDKVLNGNGKRPQDPNSETVALMQNLNIPEAELAFEEIKPSATASLGTPVDEIDVAEVARKLGYTEDLNKKLVEISMKHAPSDGPSDAPSEGGDIATMDEVAEAAMPRPTSTPELSEEPNITDEDSEEEDEEIKEDEEADDDLPPQVKSPFESDLEDDEDEVDPTTPTTPTP
ncbi:MAG: hypothetical protein AB7J40_00855 [Candidatus Altimarinota bacterium]